MSDPYLMACFDEQNRLSNLHLELDTLELGLRVALELSNEFLFGPFLDYYLGKYPCNTTEA